MARQHKIRGKALKERKSKKLQLIFTILIAFSMVSSIGAFLYTSNRQETGSNFKGYNVAFTRQGHYILSKKGVSIEVYTNPSILFNENTSLTFKNLSSLKEKSFIIITFDPNIDSNYLTFLDSGRFLLEENLAKNTNKKALYAVLTPNANYLLPVIDCKNATSQMPVIQIIAAEKQNVSALYPDIDAATDGSCYNITLKNPQQAVFFMDYLSVLLVS